MVAYLPQALDEELTLRFAEPDNPGEGSQRPERGCIAAVSFREAINSRTYRSLQMHMIGRRSGLAGVFAA